MALAVTIDGNDISSNVVGCRALETVERGRVSTATIQVYDESQSLTIAITDAVVITLDGTAMWKGEVAAPPEHVQLADDLMGETIYCEGYGKLLHETVVDEVEIVRSWPIVTAETSPDRFRIEGDYSADFNNGDTFLVRDSTANDDTWTVDTGTYDSGTDRTEIAVQENDVSGEDDGIIIEIKADDSVIDDLFDDREQDDIDDTTNVTQVLAQFENGLTLGNSTLAEAMDKICSITGARYWVTKDQDLYYTDTFSTATDDLSTDPGDVGGTTYRCWDLRIRNEQTFVNRVYVVGKANDGTIISTWVEDAASVASYGKREALHIDSTINTTDGLDDAGAKIIADNKDPSVSVTCITDHDGFSPGENVKITSSDYGYSEESLFCYAIEMEFCRRDGSDDVEYKLHLGDALWDATAAQSSMGSRIRTLENNQVATTATGSGGGSAVTSADYLTLSLTSALSAERQLTAGDGLDGSDAGANSTYTLSVDVSDFAGAGLEDDGSENLRIAASAAGQGLTGGGGSALAVGGGTGITVNPDSVEVTQETIEDWVGAMVGGNTETHITVTYQDADGTLDFVVDPSGIALDDLANTILSDPDADKIVFWNDSHGVYDFLAPSDGLVIDDVDLKVDMLGLEGLSDPGADRIYFWDDSDGASEWLTAGDGIEIDGNNLQVDEDYAFTWAAEHTFNSDTGDPIITFSVALADKFTIGIDDSDDDTFWICSAGSLDGSGVRFGNDDDLQIGGGLAVGSLANALAKGIALKESFASGGGVTTEGVDINVSETGAANFYGINAVAQVQDSSTAKCYAIKGTGSFDSDQNSGEVVGVIGHATVVSCTGDVADLIGIRARAPSEVLYTGTVTNAYCLKVDSEPSCGTNNFALWVGSGTSYFGGSIEAANCSGWLPLTCYDQLPNTAISDIYSNTSDELFYVAIPRSLTVEELHVIVYVSTTNDGSNYWTLALQETDGTEITTVDTSGISADTTSKIESTGIDTDLAESDVGLRLIVKSKTGTPGNLYALGPALYVI